ncbi:MAG: hypothetical protein QOF52_1516 [Propionibacteriaceae bacterium]|nr:hypothetical protein [Propionibacteriaceae bacterium]MDX6321658.1 hypothetical protein [Propionibacteriaceae bacterium]
MIWVLIFGAIALAGLVMVISYGVWLAHKASDVASEVVVLGRQAEQLAELVAQIDVPQMALGVDPAHSPRTVRASDDPSWYDVR